MTKHTATWRVDGTRCNATCPHLSPDRTWCELHATKLWPRWDGEMPELCMYCRMLTRHVAEAAEKDGGE